MSAILNISLTLYGQQVDEIEIPIGSTVDFNLTLQDPVTRAPINLTGGNVTSSLCALDAFRPIYPPVIPRQANLTVPASGECTVPWAVSDTAPLVDDVITPLPATTYQLDVWTTDSSGNRLQNMGGCLVKLTAPSTLPGTSVVPLPSQEPLAQGPKGDKGDTGNTGPTGPAGPVGPGSSVTWDVGTPWATAHAAAIAAGATIMYMPIDPMGHRTIGPAGNYSLNNITLIGLSDGSSSGPTIDVEAGVTFDHAGLFVFQAQATAFYAAGKWAADGSNCYVQLQGCTLIRSTDTPISAGIVAGIVTLTESSLDNATDDARTTGMFDIDNAGECVVQLLIDSTPLRASFSGGSGSTLVVGTSSDLSFAAVRADGVVLSPLTIGYLVSDQIIVPNLATSDLPIPDASQVGSIAFDTTAKDFKGCDGTSWNLFGGGSTAGEYDVTDPAYGAVGDGTTDDGPAFQAALDACIAGGGGTVKVPGGKFRIATPVAGTFASGISVSIRGVGGSASQIYVDTGASGDCFSLVVNSLSAFGEICNLTFRPPNGNVAGVTKNCKRMLYLANETESSMVHVHDLVVVGVWSAQDLIYLDRGFSTAERIWMYACSPMRDNSATESAIIHFEKCFQAFALYVTAVDESANPGTSYDGTSTFGIYFTAREQSSPNYIDPIGQFLVEGCYLDEGQGLFQVHAGERREVNSSSYKFASLTVRDTFFNIPGGAGTACVRAEYGQVVKTEQLYMSWQAGSYTRPDTILNGIDKIECDYSLVKQDNAPSEILIDDPPYVPGYMPFSGSAILNGCNFTNAKWGPRSTVKIYEDIDGVRYRRLMADTPMAAGTNIKPTALDGNGCSQLLKTDNSEEATGVTIDAAADVGTGSITCPAPGTIADGQSYYIGDYYNALISLFECRASGSVAPGSHLVDTSGISLASELATRLATAINAVGALCRVHASPSGAVVSLTKLTGYSSNGVAYNDHISKDSGIGGSFVDWSGGGHSVRVATIVGAELPAITLDGADAISAGDPLTQSTLTDGYFAKAASGTLALAIANADAPTPSSGDQIPATSTRFRNESGAFNIAAAQTSGLSLVNTTAATNSVTQYTPGVLLQGAGWKTASTAASETTAWLIQGRSIQGSAAPTQDLVFWSNINGAGWVEKWRFGSTGILSSAVTGDAISLAGNNVLITGTSGTGSGVNANALTVANSGAWNTSGNSVLVLHDSTSTGQVRYGVVSGAGAGVYCEAEDLLSSGSISAGQVVVWAGSDGKTVAAAGASANLSTIAGVALNTVTDSSTVVVARRGRCQALADAGISVGNLVGTSGSVAGNVAAGSPGAGSILGRATTATATGKVIVDLTLG